MAHAQASDKAAAEAAGEARKQHKCVALLSKQLADTQLALRYPACLSLPVLS